MNASTRKRRSRGFTLIEVLIGILIFAIGMLALASLQGSLARNSGDSNARTVAMNIAEERLEQARRFSQVGPSADPAVATFAGIASGTATESVGQIDYTVTTVVTPYYYDYGADEAGTFTTTNTDSAAYPDVKLVAVTVSWNAGDNALQFRVDDTTQTSDQLGSGSITLTDAISSIASPAGGRVALATLESTGYSPVVDYNPGSNPDIVSIELGDNKFKESTTPLPDVVRANELVETRFDVVTYSQNDAGATFLRREEFRAVSCECTLRVPSADGDGGFRPTIWDGNEYTQAEWVSKPYGESANNQQSTFCDMCCRDHHDGGSGENDVAGDPGASLYNPFRADGGYYLDGALAGDHKHYDRNRSGDFVLATADGDPYHEACRMVRKDGFFRIAQDLRQEGLNAFPADYLDETSEVEEYSDYVTEAVALYEDATSNPADALYPTNAYEDAPPLLTAAADMDTPVIFPASRPDADIATTLPTASGATQQQLRARGIYIDFMSETLRHRINCLDLGDDGPTCGVPNVTTALEIIPFYDVQLTWLARWNELPNNLPVDTTNETIADNNSHSRGLARMTAATGTSTVTSAVHTGNLGLTGTDPIDQTYDSELESYDLYVNLDLYNGPPPLSGIIISGNIISGVNGVRAADVEITAAGAQCDRTNTGYVCNLEIGANNPRITISNYFKRNSILLACSSVLAVNGTEHISDGLNAANNWTRFGLPAIATIDADIVIREDNCSF